MYESGSMNISDFFNEEEMVELCGENWQNDEDDWNSFQYEMMCEIDHFCDEDY